MADSTIELSLARRILDKAEILAKANSAEQDVKQARQDLIETIQALQLSVISPPELLEQHQVNYQSLACLGWLVRFDIFHHVPSNLDSIAYTDLAATAAVPLSKLQSVVRMAITGGLFQETSPTHIAHSRLSVSFAKDSSLTDWARFMTSYSAPMANGFAEATARWGETAAKNETAFNVAFRTDQAWFDYVKSNSDRGLPEIFAGYMRSMGKSEGLKFQHLVDGYDWASLGAAHVVDVGGSTAQASIAIAKTFPRLTFTVEDLPEVVAAGRSALANLADDDIATRIRFVEHDFFAPRHTTDKDPSPDIYLLRKILHDWPTARAREILQQLASTISASSNKRARLIIMDTILPPPGALGRVQEARLRVRDLTMVECFNSKERELVEWEELFASTNPSLELKSWKQPAGSAMAVMEVVLK
ncbi:O-methyltransferase-domain-containing protein [Phaeosphaeria sp. MPI-PUGE-AT-0046c]|nr:O-methyltransferase-domain-containing protein [Phaeosphaeria sp. MPI-PUGE-AT-0046c]